MEGIWQKFHEHDTDKAIAAGADVGTVAQIMGNDPKTILEHHQHVVDARKRAVVEAIPELPGNIKFSAEITAKNLVSQKPSVLVAQQDRATAS